MGLYEKIRGTIETLFQLGIDGPQLKGNGGAIESLDSSGTAFTNHRGADAVIDDDLVTKRQFDTTVPGTIKTGTVLNASFAGTPKTAAVTFVTDFSVAPVVQLTVEGNGNGAFVLGVESLTVNGFTINCGTNNIDDLIKVHWTASEHSNP